MPHQDREPHVDRFKCSEFPKKETDTERQEDLGHDRNKKGTFRIARTLESTGVRQCNRNENSGKREDTHQLSSDLYDGWIDQTEDGEKLRRKKEEEESDKCRTQHSKSRRDVYRGLRSIWISGAKILSCNRCGGPHQSHRRPCDE